MYARIIFQLYEWGIQLLGLDITEKVLVIENGAL